MRLRNNVFCRLSGLLLQESDDEKEKTPVKCVVSNHYNRNMVPELLQIVKDDGWAKLKIPEKVPNSLEFNDPSLIMRPFISPKITKRLNNIFTNINSNTSLGIKLASNFQI